MLRQIHYSSIIRHSQSTSSVRRDGRGQHTVWTPALCPRAASESISTSTQPASLLRLGSTVAPGADSLPLQGLARPGPAAPSLARRRCATGALTRLHRPTMQLAACCVSHRAPRHRPRNPSRMPRLWMQLCGQCVSGKCNGLQL